MLVLLVTVRGLEVHACVETKRIRVEHRFVLSEERIIAPTVSVLVDFSGLRVEMRRHP